MRRVCTIVFQMTVLIRLKKTNLRLFVIEVSRDRRPVMELFIRFSEQLTHVGKVDLRSCHVLLYFKIAIMRLA